MYVEPPGCVMPPTILEQMFEYNSSLLQKLLVAAQM